MKYKEWNEALNHIDSDLVEIYVEKKEKIVNNKFNKSVLLKVFAGVACLALIVSIVIPILSKNGLKTVDPLDKTTGNNAKYSAEYISKLFSVEKTNDVAINAYTKVFVPDNKYLYIDKNFNEETLAVYEYNTNKSEFDKSDFKNFINGFLPKLADSINAKVPTYQIVENSNQVSGFSVSGKIGDYRMSIFQNKTRQSFHLSKAWLQDGRIILDNEVIQIDQRLSDKEIENSIKSIKNKLFGIFNVSFSDVKIIRDFNGYSEYGATRISIYFYNKGAHSLNLTQEVPVTDYICISFDNLLNYDGDIVSDSILTVAEIYYNKKLTDSTKEYSVIENAKKISLKEAEDLLSKGFVFGGHSCSLCMALQDKVSFSSYDFVDIEYVFGYDSKTNQETTGIPFYAFYKKIGTSENGNAIYAKTYVAAIKVSGYDEYFKNQEENHKN